MRTRTWISLSCLRHWPDLSFAARYILSFSKNISAEDIMISFVTWKLVIRDLYLIWITLRMQINGACTVDSKVQKENGDSIAPDSFMLYNNL